MSGTIVVTGASAGIGRGVARRFLAEGWNVALLARRSEVLREVADGAPNALPVVCDVSDAGAVDAAFGATVERFGRVDVLFNNAGIFRPSGLIDEIPVSDWTDTLAVNLSGMFLCARAAFRQMRAQAPQGGRIINNRPQFYIGWMALFIATRRGRAVIIGAFSSAEGVWIIVEFIIAVAAILIGLLLRSAIATVLVAVAVRAGMPPPVPDMQSSEMPYPQIPVDRVPPFIPLANCFRSRLRMTRY